MGNISKMVVPKDAISLPKWQIALMITVPAAIGLAYYIYNDNKKNLNREKKAAASAPAAATQETVARAKSPLEKAEELKKLGNDYFRSERFDEAIKCFNEAINECPKTEKEKIAIYYQNKAAAYEQKEDYKKVIEDCTEALKYNKHYVKAILRRAGAAEKIFNYTLSLEDYAVACAITRYSNLQYVNKIEKIAQIIAKEKTDEFVKTCKPELPSRFFMKSFLSSYQHASAIDQLDMDDESSVNLLNKYKSIKEEMLAGNSIESACNDLIEECKLAGNDLMRLETLSLRATYHVISKNYAKAYPDLNALLEEENIDSRLKIGALIKRATLKQSEGDDEARKEDFDKAIELDENNPDIYHHLGQIYLLKQNLPESLDNFRKAAALVPDNPLIAAQHCYAECRNVMNPHGGSSLAQTEWLKKFEEIVQRFPENIECITLYAEVLSMEQNFEKAIKTFDNALKLEPDHVALLVHKALIILQWHGDVQGAKDLIDKAIEIDKECEFAYETYASMQMQMMDFVGAVKNFDEAIKRYTSVDDLHHLFNMRTMCEANIKVEARIGPLRNMHLPGL